MFTIVFFGDYFPFLGWLDKLTGKFSKLDKIFKECDAFYEEIINDHLDPNRPKTNEGEDLVDVLLHIKKDRSFHLTKEHIKAVLMVILHLITLLFIRHLLLSKTVFNEIISKQKSIYILIIIFITAKLFNPFIKCILL